MSNVKIKDLIADDANFNTGTEFGNALIEKSLTKFGAGRSILLDKNNRIIAGNKTVENAAANGFDNVQIVETDGKTIIAVKRTDVDLNTKKGREMALADNATAKANIEWNFEALTDWEMPAQEWGITFPEIIEEPGDADAEPQIDKAAELNKKWKVQAGDLWQIGSHRLVCGDSTDAGCVERLMEGERAELLFTSPPYSDQRTYEGDDVAVEHLVKFIPAFYPFCSYMAVNLGLKRQDNEIVEYWQDYLIEARHCGYKLLSWNIWDRSQAGMGSIGNASAMFPIVHEWIFVFGEKRKDLTPTVPNEYAGDIRKKTNRQVDGTMSVRYHETRAFSELRSVFASVMGNADQKEANHPAMFPTELPTEYIKAMTDKGQIVCEPFAGSGTTLVACQNLNRKCYAIEISENYCAVILERMSTAFPDLEIKRIEDAKGKATN